MVAFKRLIEGVKQHGKTIIAVVGIIIAGIWLWYSFSGVHDNGGTADGVRIQLERASDRQQDIDRTTESIEQRLDDSTNSVEGIRQSNSSAQMAIERIQEGNNSVEGILERDRRIIEQSIGIIESIRQTGQGEE